MTARVVCIEPDPALRLHSRPVDAFGPELAALAADLIETMYANDGIGIAAPQVGCDLQLFIANPTREQGRELIVVNPRLSVSGGRIDAVEGCLSVPDVWGRVRRAQRVRILGQDIAGTPFDFEAEGLLAIVLQHETDHLQGRLFIDRLPWIRRQWLQWKLLHKFRCAKFISQMPKRIGYHDAREPRAFPWGHADIPAEGGERRLYAVVKCPALRAGHFTPEGLRSVCE